MRNRLHTSAGLLTALTLSLGLLAGCNPASFNANPTAPAAPAAPDASALQFQALSGNANDGEAPLKNAAIQVFDALTDAPAQVVAAGGSPEAGKLSVMGDGLKTDAEGNFSLQLAGLGPDSVARIVVTAEGKTLSALVQGEASGGFKTLQTVNIQVDIASTFSNQMVSPLLALASAYDLEVKRSILRIVEEELNNVRLALKATVQESAAGFPPALRAAVMSGRPDNINATLRALSGGNSANLQRLADSINNFTESAASKALQTVEGQRTTVQVDSSRLTFVTTLPITLNGNTLTINGKTFDLTPPQKDEQQQLPVVLDPLLPENLIQPVDQRIYNFPVAGFRPTITVNSTNLQVSQGQNQDDVKEIFARVAKSNAAVPDWSVTNFGSGSVDFTPTTMPDRTLSIPQGGTAPTVTLPSDFIRGTTVGPAQAKWTGYLQLPGNVNVATFTVYEVGDYYVLYTNYQLTDSVTYTGGHSTTVSYSGLTLTNRKVFEVVMTSRKGNRGYLRDAVGGTFDSVN